VQTCKLDSINLCFKQNCLKSQKCNFEIRKELQGNRRWVSRRGVGNGRAEEQIGRRELESRQTDRDSTLGGRSGRRRVNNRKSGRWIRRRGQRSRQTDRDWTVGTRSDRRGFVNRQSGVDKVKWELRKALNETRDNLARTEWKERTVIGGAQVKVVGLIRGDQGGRRVNGKTRGGPWHPIRILITNCLTDCILGNFSACTFPWLCSNIKSNILLQVSLHQHDIFINIGVLEKRTTNAKVSIPGVNPRIPCLWFGCEYSKSHTFQRKTRFWNPRQKRSVKEYHSMGKRGQKLQRSNPIGAAIHRSDPRDIEQLWYLDLSGSPNPADWKVLQPQEPTGAKTFSQWDCKTLAIGKHGGGIITHRPGKSASKALHSILCISGWATGSPQFLLKIKKSKKCFNERGISFWRLLPEARFGQHVWEHLHL
jgi:hypothetical protein